MAITRPGVYISEVLSTSVRGGAGIDGPAACFIGTSRKGPETPTLVKSWSEYTKMFGGFPTGSQEHTDLPFAVHQFFTNGGAECLVHRVVGSGGAFATVSLVDRHDTSPVSTLTVTAKYSGAWGNSLRVKIVDRDPDSGRFDLEVLDGGSTDAHIVERFLDLSMDDSDSRYVESVINSATRGSKYITVTDEDSATDAPNNMPATDLATLGSGVDGSAPTDQALSDAVDLLDVISVPLIINYPGVYDPTVVNAAVQYAAGRGDSFVVIDPEEGQTPAEVITWASGLTSSSYGAIYYPRVKIPDPAANRAGVVRTVPAGAGVMGLIQTTDRERGPFKAPAGVNTRIVGAASLETEITATEYGELNNAHVNALKPTVDGVAVMGARTLKKNQADRYVPVRRTLNHLKYQLKELTQFAIFEPNDANLWATISAHLERYLKQFWQSGGLRGESASEAFFIKCDEEINQLSDIENGIVNIEIGVALQYPAEFIVIKLGQWEGGADAQEVVV